jgi:hypothetical protein
MANYPIRFEQGGGLEASADLYQTGLSRLQNAELDLPNVVRKRDGATARSLSRDGGEDLENAVGAWFRGRELLVENAERLYALRTCAIEPAATTGNFVDRGRWSRGVVAELGGAQTVSLSAQEIRSAVRLEVPGAEGHYCAIEAWTTAAGIGVQARNLGDGVEDGPFQLDASPSINVRGGMVTALSGLITWQNGDNLRAALWTVGNVAPAAPFTAIANPGGDAVKAFGFTSEPTRSGGFALWALQTNTTQVQVRARRSSDGALSAALNVTTGLTSAVRYATSVWYQPTPIGADVYRVFVGWAAQVAGPSTRYGFAILNYNAATNTLSTVTGATNATSGIAAVDALAVCGSPDAPSTTARFCFEQGAVRCTSLPAGGAETVVAVLERSLVVSEFRAVPSSLKLHRNVIALLGGEPGSTTDAYFLCDPFPLGDASAASEVSGEILARSWSGLTRGSRGNIVGAMSLVAYDGGDVLLWADAGQSERSSARNRVVVTRFALQRVPSRPAVLGGVAVAAFAGYARLYDGVRTCEQDWHALPVISLTGLAGGSLTAGARYTAAVRFEWTDAAGRLYRSEPTVRDLLLTAGQNTLQVAINTLQWTERPGVLAVVFVSENDGATLFRHSSVLIGLDETTTSTVTVSVTTTGGLSDNETLNAALVGGSLASVTGFMSVAGGRLWARSSLRSGLLQYSTLPVEGLAVGWADENLVELDREPTTVQELEGKIIAMQQTAITWVEGDGPSNEGNGDFGVRDVPAPLGAVSHQSTVRTPLGLVFESGRGPRLLDRGNVVRDFAARVGRIYEIEGDSVRSASYDPERGTIVMVNEVSGDAVILNDDTTRWGTEERGQTVDVAVDPLGSMAYLRVFDVLVEERSATYSPLLSWLHLTGGESPELLCSGRRFVDLVSGTAFTIEGAQSRVPVAGAPGIFGNLAFAFQNVDGQALRLNSNTPGNVSTSLAGVAIVNLAATVSGGVVGKQNGTSEGWNILHDSAQGFVAQVVNTSAGVAQAALGLGSSGTGAWRVLCWIVDLASGELRFASDLTAEVVAPLPGGTIEAAAFPLRIGDARLPPSTIRSLSGQVAAVSLWRPADPAGLDVASFAQAVKLAWDAGIPESLTRSTVDDNAAGGAGVELALASPWMRAENPADRSAHLPFRVNAAVLSGEFEGEHDLELRVYADYDDTAPVHVFRKTALEIAQARFQGLQYMYRFPIGGLRTFRAAKFEVSDRGAVVASFRASRFDVQYELQGEQPVEADALLVVSEVAA